MPLKYLFSELPYVCSVVPEQISKLCSNCFEDAEGKFCDRCRTAVYCSDECRLADLLFHESECAAILQGKSLPHRHIRLAARVFIRNDTTASQKQDLCTDFPTAVPRRKFTDLMSHRRNLEKVFAAQLNTMVEHFMQFYRGTPFADTYFHRPNFADELREIFCILRINSFGSDVSEFRINAFDSLANKEKNSTTVGIGTALYLNGSRFDHSCSPTATYRFEKNRIIFSVYEEENGENLLENIRENPTLFNNLKISYGGPLCFWREAIHVLPLNLQRQERTMQYFFTCQCPLCSDRETAVLEYAATNQQCANCEMPYLYIYETKGSIQPTVNGCRCPFGDGRRREFAAFLVWLRSTETTVNLRNLEKRFTFLMSIVADSTLDFTADTQGLISLLTLAQRYWHPQFNMRLKQIECQLFLNYSKLALQTGDYFTKQIAKTLAIKYGERFVDVMHRFHAPFDLTQHNMYCLLAHMYGGASPTAATASRVVELYEKAFKVAKNHGDEEEYTVVVEGQIEALKSRFS